MGAFDAQIETLRRRIENQYRQIKRLKNDIQELEGILDKCDRINTKVSETMNEIFSGVDRKGAEVAGNFVAYYRDQIEQIAKNNKIYSISDTTSGDKKQINQRILSYEEQIHRIEGEIASLEEKLIYYQAQNV